jgi:hypothetical protein
LLIVSHLHDARASAPIQVAGEKPPAPNAKVLPDGGVTVNEVAAALDAKGYKAEIGTTNMGTPRIATVREGKRFAIYFYNCAKEGRCAQIQFATGFALGKSGTLTYERINVWNRTRRFGKAFLDEEMDPIVEYNVDFEKGATDVAISNALDTWGLVFLSFRNFVYENRTPY